jgi:Putative Actinobacterial Holin-X, holin superfamily III
MVVADTRPVHERSLGDLTKQLSQDISALVRGEVMLAKAEVSERASIMAWGAGMVAVGVLFALIVVSCLVTAAVAALSLVVDVWLAALIVAAVGAAIAAIVTITGVRALRSAGPPLPLDAVESAKGAFRRLTRRR